LITAFTTAFASLAGDPSAQCPVSLQFRDLDGDNQLDVYEDWTKTADQRATDLVGRLDAAGKIALMAHPALASDASVTITTNGVSAALSAQLAAGLRFGTSIQYGSLLRARALWANNVQALCEASPLGIPFVLSSQPTHSAYAASNGATPGHARTHSRDFSNWPNELGIGASRRPATAQRMGELVSLEYRAVGLRMTLGPSANLATDPRWFNAQFTYGEDTARVGDMVAAFVAGAKGASLASGIATVAGDFPGAGPAKDGWDARFSKGRYLTYPGGAFDAHAAPFQRAIDAGVTAIVASYGIPETGAWTGAGGVVNGATLEQVAASFNGTLLTGLLRGHYGFDGLVLAPPGVLEDAVAFGAPWGMESSTKAERAAKAVNAGVDQFLGLSDTSPIAAANTGGTLAAGRLDAAATQALKAIFSLGLFENPYVDPDAASTIVSNGGGVEAGRQAAADGLVIVVNNAKPAGWLDRYVNGQPTAGNAGNGTGRVLPAPPGIPYIDPGAALYAGGDFDLGYVDSVVNGYSRLACNTAEVIDGHPVSTEAERMAYCEYVFIRVDGAHFDDPDSGSYDYSLTALEYGTSNPALVPVAAARTAISGTAGSNAQLIVGIDGGRPQVLAEVLAYQPSAVIMQWNGQYPRNQDSDKIFLDVAFGIAAAQRTAGAGKLPVSLPLSDVAAAAQLEDVAGDGADTRFPAGFGIDFPVFEGT
jgi:beta-glucosidase